MGESTSIPKLLKLDFFRARVEQLVDEIRHVGYPLQSHWIALVLGVGPFLDVGPDLVICPNAARHLLAWTAWLQLVPVQALPDHLSLASLLDQVRSDSSVRPEGFEATMTIPHLGRAEAARSALLPA